MHLFCRRTGFRWWILWSAAGWLAFFVACHSATAPLPPGANAFTPPAIYARWWQMAEACSGQTRSFREVRWFRVPGRVLQLGSQWVEGYWASRGNLIVVADSVVEIGSTVRHEMVHAILQTGDHPQEIFLTRCAAILNCGRCGSWSPSSRDFVIVPAESIGVDAKLELQPRESDGQRWLSLWIVASNERARAVIVTDPYRPRLSAIYGFDLRGRGGGQSDGMIASDSSTMFFRPFETKRWLYEFRVADQPDIAHFHVAPGPYIARGSYGGHWSAVDTVTISP